MSEKLSEKNINKLCDKNESQSNDREIRLWKNHLKRTEIEQQNIEIIDPSEVGTDSSNTN